MDFIDHVRDLSARIEKQAAGIQTELATKEAFIKVAQGLRFL